MLDHQDNDIIYQILSISDNKSYGLKAILFFVLVFKYIIEYPLGEFIDGKFRSMFVYFFIYEKIK